MMFIVVVSFFLTSCQKVFLSKTATYSSTNEANNQYKKVYRLDLSYQNLKQLPHDILKYENLQFINLSNNSDLDLRLAFEELKNIPDLKVVLLDSNRIGEVPENIKELKQLRQLSLVNNPTINLQDLFNHLSSNLNLKALNLSNNQLTELPINIANLKQLNNLRLSNNQLNTAVVFETLSKVEELHLLWLDNNGIAYLPPSIGKLNQVVELYLDNNDIDKLPIEIKQCERLCILYLGNNNFNQLPLEILSLKKFYMLVMYGNQISYIPDEYQKFKAPLAVLILDNNKLGEAQLKLAKKYFKGFFLLSMKDQKLQ